MTARFLAIAPRGIESVLEAEIAEFATPTRMGTTVAFEGSLEVAYQVLMWSRIASRVLRSVVRIPATSPDDLYAAARAIEWETMLSERSTFVVACSANRRHVELNTHYMALRIKDAVVDYFRDRTGQRPSIDTETPDLRVHVYVGEDDSELSVELTAQPLHRRGYRASGAQAPLRENLAAGLLMLAGFDGSTPALVDPMCGSGAFLVEAALLAYRIAPGLLAVRLSADRTHDEPRFREVQTAARAVQLPIEQPRIFGSDRDSRMIEMSDAALRKAGVRNAVRLAARDLEQLEPPKSVDPGIVIANPPYGERLGRDPLELIRLYEQLGDGLRRRFLGWRAFVFSGSASLLKHIGLRVQSKKKIMNGPIECQFVEIPIRTEAVSDRAPAFRGVSEDATMFKNRLQKNVRKLTEWAKRESIECFRLYDRDIPEFNLAVDRYGEHVQLYEYERPPMIDAHLAERRLRDAAMVIEEVLEVEREKLHVKVRQRMRDGSQYEKRDSIAATFEVREGPRRFLVNLTDYLDSGLFLDDRELRRLIGKSVAEGNRMLNLFAYTCTASVAAALANAHTTSVDLNQNYLAWGERNFRANALSPDAHRFVRGDCFRYLREPREQFDLVYVAPPTFSRSKAMQSDFDLQRDHTRLLAQAIELIKPGGRVLFATHAKKFQFIAPANTKVEDVSERTRAKDFPTASHFACWVAKG